MRNAGIHRRRRDREEAPEAGSSPRWGGEGDGLVDARLRPAARRARDRAAMSLIAAEGRRAVAVFLDRHDYVKVEEETSRLRADLLLGCLPDFVHHHGGQIAWVMRRDFHGEVLNAEVRALRVGGRLVHVLHEGYAFAFLPTERVVVSAETAPGPAHEIVSVCVRSSRCSSRFFSRWREYAREHNHLRGQAFFADGKIIERTRKYSWDDILLPGQTRQIIQTHVDGFLRNRVRLKELGVKPRRGLILAGPPGTGKTLLGKVLADTLNVSFLWVLPRHVHDAGSFEEIMGTARFVAPAVVFLEDLDLFAEQRDHSGWAGLLGELMNQLDGAAENQDLVTIATTNRLEVIEKALRNRPGRFDRVVEFGAMEELSRRRMLSRLLAKATVGDADMEHLVAKTAEYTGSQIEELCTTLVMTALEEENDFTGVSRCEQTQGNQCEPGILVTRPLIDAGLEGLQVERKARLGFHAA